MLEILNRHRAISIPLIIVLVLDLSLLAINFHISAQLEKDSTNINIAGRQRMLSQRLAKTLLLIHYRQDQNIDYASLLPPLEKSRTLFDQTLNAFSRGGLATNASGGEIRISPLQIKTAEYILAESQQTWVIISNALTAFLADTQSIHKLDGAIQAIDQHSEQLLGYMNDLTIALEKDAKRKTYLLRALQTLIVVLILASFVIATLRVIRRERYFNKLMEHSTDIVISIDLETRTTSFVSQSVSQLLGHSQQHYLGRPATRLFHPLSHKFIKTLLEQVANNQQIEQDRYEVQLINARGEAIYADMVIQLSTSEDGHNTELNADLRDISERKQTEIQLAELAHKDPLTQLPNRILFYELAEKSIRDARRDRTHFAVMFIDIDQFKKVNDSYGHYCGDQLLQLLAMDIKTNVRDSDMVARIGGDEFIVLLRDTSSEEAISRIAHKIIEKVSEPKEISGHLCQVGASIGVAIYPEDGENIDALVNQADAAMYVIKNGDKNGVGFA